MSGDNNNRKKYTNNSAHLVEAVRRKFLEVYEQDKEPFYPEDVAKVKIDDWFVKRFLLARSKNVEDAVVMMVNSMKWRKNQALRSLSPNFFPDEMYKVAGFFMYAPDKEGNLTVYFRVRYIVKVPEMIAALKMYGSYILYRLDDETGGKAITAVADFQGTGIQNADVDLLFYAISTLRNYFPAGINSILIVDLPWILRACWGVAKAWVPDTRRNLVHFITRKEVTNFIDKKNLPNFMGGNCTIPYCGPKVVPKGSPSFARFAQDVLGLTPKAAEKVTLAYKPTVEAVEAEQAKIAEHCEEIITCDNQRVSQACP